jgi:hypothetical protein
MIRVRRGAEPAILATVRSKRLRTAVIAYNRYGPGSRELKNALVGYNPMAVKDALFLAQHKKCAWCESRAHYSSSPVEHYRPKDGAHRHQRGTRAQIDDGHYWWLTWTWTNLLFSCPRCNDQGHKANFFPLAPGSAPLTPPTRPQRGRRGPKFFDTSREQSLLLDPAIDDPLDHIVWKPLQRALDRRDWKWSPCGLTDRGTATIAILKLAELADHIEHHLRIAVLPSLEEVEGHVAAGRLPEAVARWQKLLDKTLAANSPFAAATWCALEEWMPAAHRRQHGLADPVRPTGA